MRGEKRVAMTWIGDGGASTGDFYEGLNFAAVFQVPLVVIVEDNGYAYSTPVSQQTRNRDFYKRAEIFGIPGTVTDGNDVLAVYEVTKQAVKRARRGEGPTLIEVKTFRMKGHAEHDDASYVPKEVFEEWAKKDPIQRFENFLLSKQLISTDEIEQIKKRVKDEILEAQKFAEDSPYPDPATVADGVYA
jgi:TPP-dependent pyruvate/acetoin dehydrogenase alpha subunit